MRRIITVYIPLVLSAAAPLAPASASPSPVERAPLPSRDGVLTPIAAKRTAALIAVREAASRVAAQRALDRYLLTAGLPAPSPAHKKIDPKAARAAVAAVLADARKISPENRSLYRALFAARDRSTIRALALQLQAAGTRTQWEWEFVASMREAATARWLADHAAADGEAEVYESHVATHFDSIATGIGVGATVGSLLGGVPGAVTGAVVGAAVGIVVAAADHQAEKDETSAPQPEPFWDKGCPDGVIC